MFKLLAIGVSTGGPNALIDILRSLHKVKVPILIVQHISGKFPELLSASLNKITNLEVKVAQEGEVLSPNIVYLSDSGKHMVVIKEKNGLDAIYKIHYQNTDPVKSCRPSVDVLFKSLAENFSERMLILVGTGMGNDGVDGVRSIKELNPRSKVITQNKESSVVYGMNKAVEEQGLSEKSLNVLEIGSYLNSLIGEL